MTNYKVYFQPLLGLNAFNFLSVCWRQPSGSHLLGLNELTEIDYFPKNLCVCVKKESHIHLGGHEGE